MIVYLRPALLPCPEAMSENVLPITRSEGIHSSRVPLISSRTIARSEPLLMKTVNPFSERYCTNAVIGL